MLLNSEKIFCFQFVQRLFLKEMDFGAPNETLIPSDESRLYVEVKKGRTLHSILVEKYEKNRPFWRSRREGQYINILMTDVFRRSNNIASNGKTVLE